jgi:hypothetical protein
MTLVEGLRARLHDEHAGSFQLMGEDLTLIRGPELVAAAEAYTRALATVPRALRDDVLEIEDELAREAHDWLRRHNRSLHGRISGYLALGRRMQFRYPWPVVAILGLCQVIEGFRRNHWLGVVGGAADRAGFAGLERAIDGIDDILRRTNRGIFADSVPAVLRALRADDLRRAGRAELAQATIDGPGPVLMDAESRGLVRDLYAGLGEADPHVRFARLGALTLRHFAREQAIFSHHLGPPKGDGTVGLAGRLSTLRAVPAPAIVSDRRGRRTLVFRRYALPRGFDVRDHAARVVAFGDAYVASITRHVDDYQVAAHWVFRRFGTPADVVAP